MARQSTNTMRNGSQMSALRAASVLVWLLSTAPQAAANWGSSSNTAIYGNSLSRDWLYNSKGISISVHGCAWSYMTDKNTNAGCLGKSSEDGTEVWYMMSNCRRAQVAFSVYASSSSGSPSCNSGNFKESFVTQTSVMDFVAYMEDAGYKFNDGTDYSVCGNNNNQNQQGGNNNNNKNNNNNRYNNNNANSAPVGLSCSSDGSFQQETFADAYCLTRTGSTYNSMDTFNQDMSNLNCVNIYNAESGAGNQYLLQYLIGISHTCTSHDTSLCQDSAAVTERFSYASKSSSNSVFSHKPMGSSGQSWFTKLKYVMGGLLLLASFVMFTGILFTNRRRRRALMQRKYRQAKRGGRGASDTRSRRSSRSASKGRDAASRKSSSRSRRSKSRDTRKSAPSSPVRDTEVENTGIMT